MLKFIIFCTFVAFVSIVSAHYVPSSYQHVVLYQVAHQHQPSIIESWNKKPKNEWKAENPVNYDFKYEVHDEKTGDIKRQSETASNGAVKGQYSLIDADGFRRVVEYTADDINGFQATVKRDPTDYKIPQPVPKYEERKVNSHPISWYKPEPIIETWTEKAKNDWEHKEAEKPANYEFQYEVHDEKTGDIKRHSETANNGVVNGQYSLIDANGFRRVVGYTADDIHGFQATVKREPTHFKILQPAPTPDKYKPVTPWW